MFEGWCDMIKIENLCKIFDEHVLYSNFNLTIEDGEFVVFSGESGCGKTTLLNMLAAIEKPTSGKLLVDDIDITKRKNQLAYFQTRLGILFQNFALVDNYTVRKNLELIRAKSRSDISIEDALEKVGLSDKIDKKIYTLSGGEQQRVALARLMVKKCDIILADEPTGSLDKRNAATVVDIIRSLNEQGKTVIMVTHDEQLKKIGSRIIDLEKSSCTDYTS